MSAGSASRNSAPSRTYNVVMVVILEFPGRACPGAPAPGRNAAVKVTRRSNSDERWAAHVRRESTQRSPAPLIAALRLGQWSDPASPSRSAVGVMTS